MCYWALSMLANGEVAVSTVVDDGGRESIEWTGLVVEVGGVL